MSAEGLAVPQARNTLYQVASMIIDAMGTAFETEDRETALEMRAVGARTLQAVGYDAKDIESAMWGATVARERFERGENRL